ncbi:MAG TPA: addiction module protein [Verrucomicrobiae bacterium]|jgi:putative addiction module component (TIGR02574 family)|nr:addiction module protein [Verrucomicrobiae bacterium]
MTSSALEKEVLKLPPRSRVRLAEKIIESIEDYAAWDDEIAHRAKEIESGTAKGIPASEVMKNARRVIAAAADVKEREK